MSDHTRQREVWGRGVAGLVFAVALGGCACGGGAGKSATSRELEALLYASREVDAGRGEAAEALLSELDRDDQSLSEMGRLHLRLVLADGAASEERWLDSAIHLAVVHDSSRFSQLSKSLRPRIVSALNGYLDGLESGTGSENTYAQEVWPNDERGLAEEIAIRLADSADSPSEHRIREDFMMWLVQFALYHGDYETAKHIATVMLRMSPRTKYNVSLAYMWDRYGWGELPAPEPEEGGGEN